MPWPERITCGSEAVFAMLETFRGDYVFDREILHDVADANVVMSERLERVRRPGGDAVVTELRVTGVFVT